jgi:GNAT superfamily N-acetyltransferase
LEGAWFQHIEAAAVAVTVRGRFLDMEYRIRRGVADDSRAIARVQVDTWRTTYAGIVPDDFLATMDVEFRTERWKETFATGEMLMLVAEDEAEIFGFASGGKLREPLEDYDAELFAIYLLLKKQGKGAGRKLFEELARSLAGEDYKAMALWVLRKNPAVAFYRRLGGIELVQKNIEIGGQQLEEIAFGWPQLARL